MAAQIEVGLPGGIPSRREAIAKFKTIQMVDVHLPTTDARALVMSRYTQPEPDHKIMLHGMQLTLPQCWANSTGLRSKYGRADE